MTRKHPITKYLILWTKYIGKRRTRVAVYEVPSLNCEGASGGILDVIRLYGQCDLRKCTRWYCVCLASLHLHSWSAWTSNGRSYRLSGPAGIRHAEEGFRGTASTQGRKFSSKNFHYCDTCNQLPVIFRCVESFLKYDIVLFHLSIT